MRPNNSVLKMARLTVLIFLFVVSLSGCAATLKGPEFQIVDPVPDNKALIYIYWTDMWTEGAKRDPMEFTLKMDGKPLTVMIHAGYFKYYVDPGEIHISTHLNFKPLVVGLLDAALAPVERLTLHADPGQIYYIRCVVFPPRENRFVAHNTKLPMMLVEERRGVYELSGAKLLPQINLNDINRSQEDKSN